MFSNSVFLLLAFYKKIRRCKTESFKLFNFCIYKSGLYFCELVSYRDGLHRKTFLSRWGGAGRRGAEKERLIVEKLRRRRDEPYAYMMEGCGSDGAL